MERPPPGSVQRLWSTDPASVPQAVYGSFAPPDMRLLPQQPKIGLPPQSLLPMPMAPGAVRGMEPPGDFGGGAYYGRMDYAPPQDVLPPAPSYRSAAGFATPQAMGVRAPQQPPFYLPSPKLASPPYGVRSVHPTSPQRRPQRFGGGAPSSAPPPPELPTYAKVSSAEGFYGSDSDQRQVDTRSGQGSEVPANVADLFVTETLRQELFQQSQQIYAEPDPDDPRIRDIPQAVRNYHSLFPLDDEGRERVPSRIFGVPTQVYKCISGINGKAYCMRRLNWFRPSTDLIQASLDIWGHLNHPNVLTFEDAFVTKEFGDVNSLVFVHAFRSGSETLESCHLNKPGDLLAEDVLWSYTCQLVSAIRAVHSAGVAVRTLDPSKILLSNQNRRVSISGVGIMEVVKYDGTKSIADAQREDLVALGSVLLALACKSVDAHQNMTKSMDFLASHYSQELKNLVMALFSSPNVIGYPATTIFDVCGMIVPHLVCEMDMQESICDRMEEELAKEVENGRLFRLIVKLGFINERQEYDMDPSWSETGDRYLLKLFRDYVFHQVAEDGSPVLDLGHVVECLNKLDVGTSEKIALTSRDGQSLLIVSYKDLKRCVEGGFHELQEPKQPVQVPPSRMLAFSTYPGSSMS